MVRIRGTSVVVYGLVEAIQVMLGSVEFSSNQQRVEVADCYGVRKCSNQESMANGWLTLVRDNGLHLLCPCILLGTLLLTVLWRGVSGTHFVNMGVCLRQLPPCYIQ